MDDSLTELRKVLSADPIDPVNSSALISSLMKDAVENSYQVRAGGLSIEANAGTIIPFVRAHSQRYSADTAVDALQALLTCQMRGRIALLIELNIPKSTSLTSGIELVPIQGGDPLPAWLDGKLPKEFANLGTAITIPFSAGLASSADDKPVDAYQAKVDELQDVVRCVQLLTHGGGYSLWHAWLLDPEMMILPSNYTWLGTGVEIASGHKISVRLDQEGLDDLIDLHRSFVKLSEKDRDIVRLVIDRLASSTRRMDSVNRAIDLGVALEAFYLPDLNIELSYRLRLRAARWLRKTAKDRKEMVKLVNALYQCRSTAVHTGRLDKVPSAAGSYKSLTPEQMFKKGRIHVTEAVKKCIKEGKIPNWESVELN